MRTHMKLLKVGGIAVLVLVGILLVIVLAALLLLHFYPAVGKTPDKDSLAEYGERTDLFYDGIFHNENDYSVMTGDMHGGSDRLYPEDTIPVIKNTEIQRESADDLAVTWCGHSSILVQLGNQNVFLDPILSERASPVGFAGPKRFSEPAIDLDDVPDIDVIFISHDHYDHLDHKTITAIDDRVGAYVIPLGIDCLLSGWGVDESKLYPLAWWESAEINGVTYTLIPAQHNSGRNPLKANVTLWGGIHMDDGQHSVYYTGDTGYYDVFSLVYDRFGAVDLMMADAGQYDPAWAMTHMDPEQSVQAAKDAQAKWYIPIHWGEFVLSTHAWDEPPALAVQAAEQLGVNIATPRLGEKVDYRNIAGFNEHWWEGIE